MARVSGKEKQSILETVYHSRQRGSSSEYEEHQSTPDSPQSERQPALQGRPQSGGSGAASGGRSESNRDNPKEPSTGSGCLVDEPQDEERERTRRKRRRHNGKGGAWVIWIVIFIILLIFILAAVWYYARRRKANAGAKGAHGGGAIAAGAVVILLIVIIIPFLFIGRKH